MAGGLSVRKPLPAIVRDAQTLECLDDGVVVRIVEGDAMIYHPLLHRPVIAAGNISDGVEVMPQLDVERNAYALPQCLHPACRQVTVGSRILVFVERDINGDLVKSGRHLRNIHPASGLWPQVPFDDDGFGRTLAYLDGRLSSVLMYQPLGQIRLQRYVERQCHAAGFGSAKLRKICNSYKF